MAAWSMDSVFTNVTKTVYPDQLECSRTSAGMTSFNNVVGVGVSPVSESNWPAVVSCCPSDQISFTNNGGVTRNGVKSWTCQAWCLTTTDKVAAVNTCYQDHQVGNSTLWTDTGFRYVRCEDIGSKACSGAIVQPSSTSMSLQSTSTSVSSTTSSRGMAVATQVSLKSIGALVLDLSAVVLAA